MVEFMNVLVERSPMQRPMEPVVPSIFQDEEDRNLIRHLV